MPNQPAEPAPSVTPTTGPALVAARVLGAVVAAQVLGLVAVAVLVATRLGDGRVPPVLADLAAALVGAVVVGALGRSVVSGARGGRAALVTVELLCVPVGAYAVAGGQPEFGVPTAVLGVLGFLGVFVLAGTLPDDAA